MKFYPPKVTSNYLTLGTCECDLICKKGLCRCHQVKIRVGPSANDWCPYKKREIWTQRFRHSTPSQGTGRDWNVAPTNQGTPRIPRSHQKLGERQRTDNSSEPPEGTNPQHLDFRLPVLRTEITYFSWLKPPGLLQRQEAKTIATINQSHTYKWQAMSMYFTPISSHHPFHDPTRQVPNHICHSPTTT